MRFRHIPTGEELTPRQVIKKFSNYRHKDGRQRLVGFPKDVGRWDDVLLKSLELERV